jgi:transcriptional regulator with XRE-family HTH domain
MTQAPITAAKVGQILRLHDLGLTQKAIAVQVGVGQATVSNYLQVHRPKPEPEPGAPPERPLGRTPIFDVPAGLDPESRRVVEYVNAEIRRWNSGARDEPIDLIVAAARDRLRRIS